MVAEAPPVRGGGEGQRIAEQILASEDALRLLSTPGANAIWGSVDCRGGRHHARFKPATS